MADVVDKATRSRMMSGIKGKNTKPEMVVRQGLHRAGFRFRLHAPGLPGKPDLLLPKWRAAIFVHGCFWHRHEGCRFTTTPATRPAFWDQKFGANVLRDERAFVALQKAGWRVATVWECAVRRDARGATERLARWITSDSGSATID
ncbi:MULTISPECIES: very short patch repair endonuclease [unclassified Brevundimonas]|uniref:very short patch repair endonuclease n=1 Tax=unclassified Brevundimonas TaxID=2622653 RepID=UPI0009E86D4B|nr:MULTISPECIES: DNA mismatch endonuclease Vsr [unclassified Brevundimonas]